MWVASMPCGLPADETIPLGALRHLQRRARQERLPHGPGPPLRPAHADHLGHPLQLVAAGAGQRRVLRAHPQLPPPQLPAAVALRRLAGGVRELRAGPQARAAAAGRRHLRACRTPPRCAWGAWATRATRRRR
jgi:hypothetical protein